MFVAYFPVNWLQILFTFAVILSFDSCIFLMERTVGCCVHVVMACVCVCNRIRVCAILLPAGVSDLIDVNTRKLD